MIAEASTQLILMAISVSAVWRIVGFGFPVRGIARIAVANVPVLLSVIAVSATFDSNIVALLVGLAVTVPAYGAGLWATRALTPFETRYLRGLLPSSTEELINS